MNKEVPLAAIAHHGNNVRCVEHESMPSPEAFTRRRNGSQKRSEVMRNTSLKSRIVPNAFERKTSPGIVQRSHVFSRVTTSTFH